MASDLTKEKGQRRGKGGVVSDLPKPEGKRNKRGLRAFVEKDQDQWAYVGGEVDFGFIWEDCLGN